MRAAASWILVLVAFLASPAAAKDANETEAVAKANALLADAEKARKAKEWDKAARAIADEVVLAQKERDLGLEQRGAEALEDLLDDADRERAPAGGTTASAGPREVLAIVMKALEPVRHGAYLSAHALATELVLRAVEKGDAAHLEAAEGVLATFAATPKSGKGGAALAKLAQAVKSARAGDAAGARKAFEVALPLVKQGRWLRATLAAHLEWMALQAAAGDLAAAATTLQDAVGYLAPKQDDGIARAWVAAARERLAAAPEELRSAFNRAVEPYTRGGGAGMEGGRGGAGESAGGNVSPLGRAWPKLAPDKPFATVKRTDTGFDIRVSYDKKFAVSRPHDSAQKPWDQDGLTFVFADGGVALRILDMRGTAGQPGERSTASPAWGWYYLAPGETYGVTKAGLVVVN